MNPDQFMILKDPLLKEGIARHLKERWPHMECQKHPEWEGGHFLSRMGFVMTVSPIWNTRQFLGGPNDIVFHHQSLNDPLTCYTLPVEYRASKKGILWKYLLNGMRYAVNEGMAEFHERVNKYLQDMAKMR